MAAVLGCQRSVWESMTLKHLVIMHDAYLIDRWWPTAMIASQLYNIQAMIHNAYSKGQKLKPKSISEFHPFVKQEKSGFKIGAKNLSIMRQLGKGITPPR